MFTTEGLTTALADRYTIERLIGEGGMARVFLARDLRHNRRVALKVVRPDLGAVVGIERFQAEIQVTANLQHPNLLPLFDSGSAGDLLFYVMPFVEGESLRHRIDREKQLPVDEAVRIATAIAGALDYAHRHGVIHRDLKPENILLQEGQPLVADFGIALAISNAGGARITQTGLSLGTPQYMSPEQATGDRAIDGRTDIYSLGALTYEMLTGEPPHTGTTSQAIIARVLTQRPRGIRLARPSVPEHVEAAVELALEKLPADRWATPRDFAEALTGARQVSRTTTAPSGQSPRGVASRISRARDAVALSLVVALAGTTAYFAFRASRPASTITSAEFDVTLPDGFELPIDGSAASVALSRDGRTLVFVGHAKGLPRRMLYARRVGQRLVQEIRGTEDALSPIFGPDGREVLFALRQPDGGGIIKRIDIGGGTPRTLTDSGNANGQLSWHEGNEIIIVVAAGSLALLNSETAASSFLARPDTGHAFGFPDILPGGKAALITIKKRIEPLDSTLIGTVTIPGGKVTSLGVRGLSPRYSKTGHIVFATAGQLLSSIPFDAARLRVTGSPTVIAEDVGGGIGGAVPFAVSDEGTVAFIRGRTTTVDRMQPVIVNRSGVIRSIGGAAGLYSSPRISPDGRQVVYVSGKERNGAEMLGPDIWRLDVSTGQAQRLTTNHASDYPAWSSDGSEVYYAGGSGDATEYAIALSANPQPRRVFAAPGRRLQQTDRGPPHGYVVMSVSETGTSSDLWIANLDSLNAPRVFAAGPYTENLPRLSPNGQFVAYQSSRTGSPAIYIRPVAGNGEEVRVSPNAGNDPVWSRDGRELFFVTGFTAGESSTSQNVQLMAAQVTMTPKVAVTGVRTLFPLRPYVVVASRSSYDVFPNGDFMFLAWQQPDSGNVRPAFVMRTGWPSFVAERRRNQTP